VNRARFARDGGERRGAELRRNGNGDLVMKVYGAIFGPAEHLLFSVGEGSVLEVF